MGGEHIMSRSGGNLGGTGHHDENELCLRLRKGPHCHRVERIRVRGMGYERQDAVQKGSGRDKTAVEPWPVAGRCFPRLGSPTPEKEEKGEYETGGTVIRIAAGRAKTVKSSMGLSLEAGGK